MPTIDNDRDLRAALAGLSPERQRILGLRFAHSVIRLVRDERVTRAIETGLRDDCTPEEWEDAYRAAKAHATRTYTDCGKETDWLAQADHFAAAAAAAALLPDTEAGASAGKGPDHAWRAAVQARMAVNCETMESDTADAEGEIRRQYAIACDFLG